MDFNTSFQEIIRLTKGVGGVIAGFFLFIILGLLVVWWIYSARQGVDYSDQQRAAARLEIKQEIDEQDETLEQTEWVSEENQVVKLPIQAAMQVAMNDLAGKDPTDSGIEAVWQPPAMPGDEMASASTADAADSEEGAEAASEDPGDSSEEPETAEDQPVADSEVQEEIDATQ
jgi:hypothetical protein